MTGSIADPGMIMSGPLLAPAGTITVMLRSGLIVAVAQLFEPQLGPNTTAYAPATPGPTIVTTVPGGPLVGLNDTVVTTVKLSTEIAAPPGVVTVSGPLVAPAGTVTCRLPSGLNVEAATVPPGNVTEAYPR